VAGLLLCCLLWQAPETRTLRPLIWRFSPGQEFFVEETHRQLYQIKAGAAPVTTYLDYSLLRHYQVKPRQGSFVEVEITLEQVRINNPIEAGSAAIQELKKKEGSKVLCQLRRQDHRWHIVANSPGVSQADFTFFLLTLGSPQFDAAHPAWEQSWELPAPAAGGTMRLVLHGEVKSAESEPRLRAELRPELRWIDAGPLSENRVQVVSQPNLAPGWALYDVNHGWWEYADFRVAAVVTAQQGTRQVEIKQDFSAIYRVTSSKPVWTK
jgi:hypothetical protein